MSKCPECDGTGKVVHPMMSMNGDEYTGEWEQYDCEACNGTGEIGQTEQEYIQTCTTEQLAEEIYECVMTHPWHISKEVILEWLKQPHTTPQKQDDYPCNVKGCSLETRQACCGCPDYFEWEKQNR